MRCFGELFIVRPTKDLRLEEKSLTSCFPVREIQSDRQLYLMSFVKIHPSQTSGNQCPILVNESSIDTPTLRERLGTMLAPLFFSVNNETFPDILVADKHPTGSKWVF